MTLLETDRQEPGKHKRITVQKHVIDPVILLDLMLICLCHLHKHRLK